MRRLPPPLLLALALALVMSAISIASFMSDADPPASPSWLLPVIIGMHFTVAPLFIAGMLEMRQRVAAIGFAAIFALHVGQTIVVLDLELWRRLHEVTGYGYLAAHLVVMGSLAVAVWKRRPGLAVLAIASAVLTVPPAGLEKLMWNAAGSFRNIMVLEMAARIPELVVLFVVSLELARESEPSPVVAADGLRHASRALCVFSAVAAVAGIRAIHQPVLLTALAAGSLGWCAFGLLRAARSPLHRWLVTFGAAAILRCASPLIAALPHVYRHDAMPEGSAMPIVMLVAVAVLLTIAMKQTVDKMQLQAKGIGSIMMFVTALAIALFLVPQSQSERSMIALGVLTGFVTALGAWMLSWLCKLAAERFERSDSELPAARVL